MTFYAQAVETTTWEEDQPHGRYVQPGEGKRGLDRIRKNLLSFSHETLKLRNLKLENAPSHMHLGFCFFSSFRGENPWLWAGSRWRAGTQSEPGSGRSGW